MHVYIWHTDYIFYLICGQNYDQKSRNPTIGVDTKRKTKKETYQQRHHNNGLSSCLDIFVSIFNINDIRNISRRPFNMQTEFYFRDSFFDLAANSFARSSRHI